MLKYVNVLMLKNALVRKSAVKEPQFKVRLINDAEESSFAVCSSLPTSSWCMKLVGRPSYSPVAHIQHNKLTTNYGLALYHTVKPVFFACPLFHEFHKPDKFAKITGRENSNTVAFQCSRKQNTKITGSKIIKLTQTPKLRVTKIKGFTVFTNVRYGLSWDNGV